MSTWLTLLSNVRRFEQKVTGPDEAYCSTAQEDAYRLDERMSPSDPESAQESRGDRPAPNVPDEVLVRTDGVVTAQPFSQTSRKSSLTG